MGALPVFCFEQGYSENGAYQTEVCWGDSEVGTWKLVKKRRCYLKAYYSYWCGLGRCVGVWYFGPYDRLLAVLT
jgi:hypothetical protein